eukprot:15026699-Alexandrium_andersonii.AAC.1
MVELLFGAVAEEARREGRRPCREAQGVAELRPISFELDHHEAGGHLRLREGQLTELAASGPGALIVLLLRAFSDLCVPQGPGDE